MWIPAHFDLWLDEVLIRSLCTDSELGSPGGVGSFGGPGGGVGNFGVGGFGWRSL